MEGIMNYNDLTEVESNQHARIERLVADLLDAVEDFEWSDGAPGNLELFEETLAYVSAQLGFTVEQYGDGWMRRLIS
jgi:hypothetical protein